MTIGISRNECVNSQQAYGSKRWKHPSRFKVFKNLLSNSFCCGLIIHEHDELMQLWNNSEITQMPLYIRTCNFFFQSSIRSPALLFTLIALIIFLVFSVQDHHSSQKERKKKTGCEIMFYTINHF